MARPPSSPLLTLLSVLVGVATLAAVPRLWCGRDADAWYAGDAEIQLALARELVAFEERDTAARSGGGGRFEGEWALVTHQMVALGLAQVAMAHPEQRAALGPVVRTAALRSFLPEMRDFGTDAWKGEDALSDAALEGPHGHAYLAYSALAVGVSCLVDDRPLPPDVERDWERLVAAYEAKLAASPTGLIATYPGEGYPTDVAAVAATIAVHGRVTGPKPARTTRSSAAFEQATLFASGDGGGRGGAPQRPGADDNGASDAEKRRAETGEARIGDHRSTLAGWADAVRRHQVDPVTGLVWQRMNPATGERHDAPRASGTGLAAYFAGFVDRALALELGAAVARQERTFLGFSGIREYGEGHDGRGDVDSGPVIFGVSVSGTGFALAALRVGGEEAAFERVYRTTDLFGLPVWEGGGEPRLRYRTGGPIGNALLLALLTSGPERAP